ncbi:hypothetical protein G7Y79_00059g091850 [Physcia stellaris]|nr:hypothetical protein G7Y79_00059g091850 [Physcia stellaris]
MDPAPFSTHRHTFLSLPLEIRLQVYDLALVKRLEDGTVHNPITIVKRRENSTVDDHIVVVCDDEQGFPPSPALLRSNRQIHAEAASTLYGSNTFKFSDPTTLNHWLTQIGTTNSLSVRQLQLSLTLYISLERNPHPYSMSNAQMHRLLNPLDPERLTLEIQGASQDWFSLFRRFASEATGLRTLGVGFHLTFQVSGSGTDPGLLVQEIGRLEGLERIEMEGKVARKWVEGLRRVSGARVLENGREVAD